MICSEAGLIPKQVWADPCQVAKHWALGQRGVALIDLHSTLRPIYSQFIVQLECSVQIIH